MKHRYIFIIFCILTLSNCNLFLYWNAPVISQADVPAVVYTSRVYVNASGETDEVITGWKITTSDKRPDPEDPGWFEEKPFIDLSEPGLNTFYLWARNADNDISKAKTLEVRYIDNHTRDWTFMIWMDGDNNLEPAAIDDLNEMEYGLQVALGNDPDIQEKIAIVVQLDRIAGYDTTSHDPWKDWTETRRYLVRPDISREESDLTSQLLAEPGEINMGNAAELAAFIEYTKTYFPAQHYALFLWNHGAGVRSLEYATDFSRFICQDTTDEDDGLYTAELTDILGDAHDVDLIAMDACLVGMVEIGYEYRPGSNKFGADYFVASPAEEQWDGLEYNYIFGRLAGSGSDGEGDPNLDPATLSAAQLAELIVKEYADFVENEAVYQDAETMTAFDLSQVSGVKNALDTLAGKMAENRSTIEAIRGGGTSPVTLEYFKESYSGSIYNHYEWIYNPHFDLYDLAERISHESSLDQEIRDAAAALMTAVDNCVVTSYLGSDYAGRAYGDNDPVGGKHGLGIFFPEGDSLYSTYNKTHYQLQWFYTEADTNTWWEPEGGEAHLYGKLDFCNSDEDGTVETWRELLEYWYDIDHEGDWTYYTPGHY